MSRSRPPRLAPPSRSARSILFAVLLVAATVGAPAAADGVVDELSYVQAIRSGNDTVASGLVTRTSPKLDLVMIVAALADTGRLFYERGILDNPLGGYWANNTRQFAFEAAPQHLRELRAQGLWGDRLLEFAMHLSEPPGLERMLPWSESLLSAAGGSADETPGQRLDRLVEEIRDLAGKARFAERYADKAGDYRQIEETVSRSIRGEDPALANAEFWGVDVGGDFYLIPSPMVLGGNTASLQVGDRTHHFLTFGPAREATLANEGFLRHLTYHELSHALVDPILEARAADLDGSKQLWFAVSGDLSSNQNILTWDECIGEHLLRAYSIRLLRESDPVLAEISVTTEQFSGFLYARQFVGLLDSYAADRERWPTLTDFMPEMATRLNALAVDWSDLDPRSRPPEFAVLNDGFEQSGDGWMATDWQFLPAGSVQDESATGRTEVARDGAVGHGGSSSLRLTVRDTTRDLISVEQGPLAVRSGSTVRVSGWLKTEGVERRGDQQKVCGFYVLFLDRGGEVLSRGETDSAVGTLDWTELSGEFVAPAGTAHARLGMLLGMSGTVWFDDVKFERLD